METAGPVSMLDCPNSEKVLHISSQNLSCFNLCPLYFKLKLMSIIFPHSQEVCFKYA